MSIQFISAEELKRRILERGSVYNDEELDVFAAAVIREERKRILDASITQFPMGDGTYMMIRTSVLEPEKVVDANSEG